MDLLELYRQMYKARAFEDAQADLWRRGLISGEMHLGTGEEAIAAGVTAHMREGDAIALDHRSTPVMTLLGVDPTLMLKEMLGREDGLCRGWGGHMHLFSPAHLAGSSGIVGAAGPIAAGFALSAKHLRPKAVAVAFFGDGASNQGMLLESFNLAAAWSLPMIFVCKDNGWAITTRSASVTGGNLVKRAAAFGLHTEDVDGLDAQAVHAAAGRAFEHVRRGKGPRYLHARCSRLDGHFLNDPMLRTASHPVSEGKETFSKVISSALSRKGGGLFSRAASMGQMMDLLRRARKDKRSGNRDPLERARRALKKQGSEVAGIEEEIDEQLRRAMDDALEGMEGVQR